jgi:hypothetical protein
LSALCTGRLHPRLYPWYSFLEAESTPGHMVLSVATQKSPVTPPGYDVAQCLNHYATPDPLDRSKAIFNYRLSRARRVVESAFGICASKWRILDKATVTEIDTDVDIVQCIALQLNVIIDFEGYCCLHSRLSQHYSLSLQPTRSTRKQRTKKLGHCYQPERPFCTLARYTLRIRTASLTYLCSSVQVSGRENARERWSLALRT